MQFLFLISKQILKLNKFMQISVFAVDTLRSST